MVNIVIVKFVVVVFNVGGLGLIGVGGNDVVWVKEEIYKIR